MRFILLGAMVLPALTQAQPARRASVRAPSGSMSASLDSVAKAVLASGVPGLTMLIARGDKPVYFKSFGLANLDVDAPATNRTVYHIASITKQFTAAAILRLVEERKVSLDASITTYLPELPRQMAPITIRHLLTHTSGLEGGVASFLTGKYALRLDYPRGEFADALFTALAARTTWPAPGERFAYADVNYTPGPAIGRSARASRSCS